MFEFENIEVINRSLFILTISIL